MPYFRGVNKMPRQLTSWIPTSNLHSVVVWLDLIAQKPRIGVGGHQLCALEACPSEMFSIFSLVLVTLEEYHIKVQSVGPETLPVGHGQVDSSPGASVRSCGKWG